MCKFYCKSCTLFSGWFKWSACLPHFFYEGIFKSWKVFYLWTFLHSYCMGKWSESIFFINTLYNKAVSIRINTEGEYNPFISSCSSWDNEWRKITGTDIIRKPQNPINEHRNNKFKRGHSSLALSYKYELIQNMNRTVSIRRKYKQIWTVKNIINSIKRS